MTEVVIEEIDLLEKIRKSEAKDNKVVKAIEKMKQADIKMLRNEEWQEEDRLMLKDEKIYIPKNKKLRTEVIQLYYNIPVEGHRGQWKTTELVTRNF